MNNSSFFTLQPSDHPSLLNEIYDPPERLTYRGTIPPTDRPHLAVVGSRKATGYGKDAARMLVRDLARAGVVIVSGLAYGIDQMAHEATIEVGGTTIAVLGFGINHRGTSREEQLKQSILNSGGLLMSEFEPTTPGHKSNFPKRNRVISGLCHGVLVIEATERSGSLITSRTAMEQNRDVFAVPGPITSPNSEGTNRLIKQGAHPVTCAKDIFDVLGIEPQPIESSANSAEESLLLKHLSPTPTHIDDLSRLTRLKSALIASTLSLMELNGLTKHVGGMRYVRL